jgi:hypothetical protein
MPTPQLEAAAASTRTEQDVRDARKIGAPVAAYQYKLINAESGVEVSLPLQAKAWDGSHHWIERFKPSRFQGNAGFVYSRTGETFVPSVFGLKIVVAA